MRDSFPSMPAQSKPPFEPRPPRPDIDQSVILSANSGTSVDLSLVFDQLLASNDTTTATHPLFTLPTNIRRRIYGYCLPTEDRTISLSPHFATKAVWPNGHFASPWDVLEEVMGGLSSFKALRNELMVYFWTEYKFHVTLNPFSGPTFSPLSHVWLQEHLGMVQKLTLEVDLTRFGVVNWSMLPNSATI